MWRGLAWCVALVLSSALSCALLPAVALAQQAVSLADVPTDDADANDEQSPEPSAELAPVDDATLESVLNSDPYGDATGIQAKSLRMPAQRNTDAAWSGGARRDGSASYSVKKELATPWDARWDAKIGADLNAPPRPVSVYEPGGPLPGSMNDRASTRVWANVAVPDLATVEMRAEPAYDRSKIGTSVQRSVPIGSRFSVTLQNDISFTEHFAMAVPATPGLAIGAAPSQIWGNEKTVKLNILPTGTTLAAGTSSSSADPLTHNKFSAEQKIYGALNVTGAVTDIGQPTGSKSLTAGFKLDW